MIRALGFSSVLALAVVLAPFAVSTLACQDQGAHAGHEQAGEVPQTPAAQPAAKEWPGDPYMLATDPVSGAPLGPIEKQVVVDADGREFRFASAGNAATFKADPGKYLPAVDDAMIEQQRPFYPLGTCVVSNEGLGGEMGEAIDFIFRNRLVRFCCADCKPKFVADPTRFIALLDKAVIAQQGPGYPLKTCPVSGDPLGGDMGDPVDAVFGNRLVRFCCKVCPKEFREDPLRYLGKLPAVGPGKAPAEPPAHGDHDHGGH